MKSLLWLTGEVLHECGTRCDADPSRDWLTVKRRTEHEGDSFLTITLPSFCQAFERALASGRLEPSMTPSFAWHRRGLPAFLRGFLIKVFSTDGSLLQDPSIDAIACIRQICLLHKKVSRDCTDVRKRKAVEAYLECEREVRTYDQTTKTAFWAAFERVSAIVWSDVVRSVPFGNVYERLIPRHGPGSTQERVRGNAKYAFKSWFQRLEDVFPFTEFGVVNARSLMEDDTPMPSDFTEPENEPPVKVVFVPKTLKTPRVIAMEPVCMQYMQQAILRELVPLIEGGRYTGGRVNFTYQSVNQKLALEASRHGRYATLDMKEASDRVSLAQVTSMLKTVPTLLEQILACRSTRAELPTGEVIPLSKFASMGSALCFPMEAMVFFNAIVTSRLLRANAPVTPRNLRIASRGVYVYGDDIVVPADEASSICVDLEDFGLRVNQHKSFWTGKFRESCGVDAYAGEDVTPTYCRWDAPSDRSSAERMSGWVAMANQFYLKGFWQTARAIRSHVESILGKLPFGTPTSVGLCWYSFSNAVTHTRWNKDLHSLERKVWVVKPRRRKDPLRGDRALLKCMGIIGCETVDPYHLESSVVRGGHALRLRWAPAL